MPSFVVPPRATVDRAQEPALRADWYATETTQAPPTTDTQGRWAFGGDALPTHPEARVREKRGRRILIVSFLFCPCHLPLALWVLSAVFAGSAYGAAVTGNALRVGAVMVSLYAFLLWRGFRQIRWAKRIEAAGGTVSCTPTGCEVLPPQ